MGAGNASAPASRGAGEAEEADTRWRGDLGGRSSAGPPGRGPRAACLSPSECVGLLLINTARMHCYVSGRPVFIGYGGGFDIVRHAVKPALLAQRRVRLARSVAGSRHVGEKQGPQVVLTEGAILGGGAFSRVSIVAGGAVILPCINAPQITLTAGAPAFPTAILLLARSFPAVTAEACMVHRRGDLGAPVRHEAHAQERRRAVPGACLLRAGHHAQHCTPLLHQAVRQLPSQSTHSSDRFHTALSIAWIE